MHITYAHVFVMHLCDHAQKLILCLNILFVYKRWHILKYFDLNVV